MQAAQAPNPAWRNHIVADNISVTIFHFVTANNSYIAYYVCIFLSGLIRIYLLMTNVQFSSAKATRWHARNRLFIIWLCKISQTVRALLLCRWEPSRSGKLANRFNTLPCRISLQQNFNLDEQYVVLYICISSTYGLVILEIVIALFSYIHIIYPFKQITMLILNRDIVI